MAHATGNGGNWVIEMRYEEGRGALLYRIGVMNFLGLLRLHEGTAVSLDLAYAEVPGDLQPYWQPRDEQGQIVQTLPRIIFEPDLRYQPAPRKAYGFGGGIKQTKEHHFGKLWHGAELVCYPRLKFMGEDEQFYFFGLPFGRGGEKLFKGTSGAPICDRTGSAVLAGLPPSVQTALLAACPPPGCGFGNGVADALFGLPTNWVRGSSGYISGTGTEYDFFAQDRWKIRPNLTMTLGLRYEYNSLITDKYNHIGGFDFNKGLLLAAGASAASLLNFVGTTGASGLPIGQFAQVGTENLGSTSENRALQHPDHTDFGPRLGIAWMPFGESEDGHPHWRGRLLLTRWSGSFISKRASTRHIFR